MRFSHVLAGGSAIVLGSVLVQNAPVQAANLVTYDFTVYVNDRSDSGGILGDRTYSGSFTYNDADLIRWPAISYVDALSASFTFEGVTYTQNDFNDGFAPLVFLANTAGSTEVFGLKWLHINPVPPINSPSVFQFSIEASPGFNQFFYGYNPIYDPDTGEYNGGYGRVSYSLVSSQPIPEPTTIVGTILFGGAVGFKRFKRAKQLAK